MKTKFELGQTVITAHAVQALDPDDVRLAVQRHARGDWGDICAEDAAENDLALREDARLFSVYHDSNGATFWIVTEPDRSATTILLPEDY